MKNLELTLVFIFAVFIFASCEFQLNSSDFREIAPPDTTRSIEVNLSPFETEYMFTVPTLVNYDLNTFGLKVYNVEFFVGEQSIHKGSEAVGEFVFYPSPWGIGVQTMSMVITTSSETGSLADLLGAEGLVFQQSWNVLLDGGNPNAVDITNVFNDGGMLKIEWEKYTRFNFEKYVLYKNFGEAEWSGAAYKVAEITDQNIHSWQDSSFVGGTANYWIEVHASQQKAISQRKQFHYDYPRIDTAWVNGKNAKFRWGKNAFYRAVKKVTLTTPYYYYNPDLVLFQSENINDTSCVVENLRFGAKFDYTLSFHPKATIEMSSLNQALNSKVSFGIGTSIPEYQRVICDTENRLAYFSDYEKIYQFNIPKKEITSSVDAGFFASCFISSFDNSLVTEAFSSFTLYNPHNLNDKKVVSANDLDLHSFFSTSSISSNNKTLGSIGMYLACYDWTRKEIIYMTDIEESATLSDNGKYASTVIDDYSGQRKIRVYSVSDSGFRQIDQFSTNVDLRLQWLPNSSKILMIVGSEHIFSNKKPTVLIYDAEQLRYETEYLVDPGKFCGIDIALNLIAFWDCFPGTDDKRNLYLYNLKNGELVKTISLAPRMDGLYFSASTILSGQGYCIDISEL